MPQNDDLYKLPENIPIPIDDGACNHLTGLYLPSIALKSTSGRMMNLADLLGYVVIYCYPRTGEPNKELPEGWNEIPGARGCTPQACAFRDHYQELKMHGAQVFGLSSQDTPYQQEAVKRLHLPFELLSDFAFEFVTSLKLPTFDVAGITLIKRLTLIVNNRRIEKVFYPVFPPDKNAAEIIHWLTMNKF